MELSKFVSETLNQIAVGVCDAQMKYAELGGVINPRVVSSRIHHFHESSSVSVNNDEIASLSFVSFDVNLIEDNSSERSGGIGVGLSMISIGGKQKEEDSHTSATRVQFSIPIILPSKVVNIEKNRRD